MVFKTASTSNRLLRDQNIYILNYTAHVISSYTMNKVEFAEEALKFDIISPLMELLRGKISWVEQRVAVRVLAHLANYERTFEAVAQHEEEIVQLAMQLASACLDVVYVKFTCRADLVELRSFTGRSRVGDPIAEVLLMDYKENKKKKGERER
uniref:ARM repeat N-terminal plant domain-containing protein n=1 Tax=Nelumbo nucifera TaxID=4432 RepID=A0A822YD43_NELNU|nr:TPA_asm: hypothetical protein HUJ06_030909 [Nelumbo nucifera]